MNPNESISTFGALGPAHKFIAFILAMARTWMGATFLVCFGMAYWHFGSTWYGFNLVVASILTWLGVKALHRRVKAAKGARAALIISILAVVVIWNFLDAMGGIVRPSQTIYRTFDLYPMYPVHVLLRAVTGVWIVF